MVEEWFDRDFLESLDKLATGAFVVNNERKIVFWNMGIETMTGLSKEKVEGEMCFNSGMACVDAYGRKACTENCPLVRSMERQKPVAEDYMVKTRMDFRIRVRFFTVPLIFEGKVMGAFAIVNDLSIEDILGEKLEEMSKVALEDQLTGLPNRRAMEIILETELNAMKRRQIPGFGVCMLDIDHFKKINDEFGHMVGDRILRDMGKLIQSVMRKGEYIFRFGGEEFLIIFRESESEKLVNAAERIRLIVSKHDFGVHRKRITLSAGVTPAGPEDTITSLVERADRAMYASKMKGRDCTTYLPYDI